MEEPKITFKKAKPSDSVQIALLEIQNVYEDISDSKLAMAYKKMLKDEKFIVFLGWVKKIPVLSVTISEKDGEMGIVSIVTDKNHRRKGYATSAIKFLIDLFKKEGKKKLVLKVIHDGRDKGITSKDLVSFYQKLGFKNSISRCLHSHSHCCEELMEYDLMNILFNHIIQ